MSMHVECQDTTCTSTTNNCITLLFILEMLSYTYMQIKQTVTLFMLIATISFQLLIYRHFQTSTSMCSHYHCTISLLMQRPQWRECSQVAWILQGPRLPYNQHKSQSCHQLEEGQNQVLESEDTCHHRYLDQERRIVVNCSILIVLQICTCSCAL